MTYDVMLTFDINKKENESIPYSEVNKKLLELNFEQNWQKFDSKFVQNELPESNIKEYELPKNTYLAKFPDSSENYTSQKGLAEFLKRKLEEVFTDLNVNGKCVFIIDKSDDVEINGSAFEF